MNQVGIGVSYVDEGSPSLLAQVGVRDNAVELELLPPPHFKAQEACLTCGFITHGFDQTVKGNNKTNQKKFEKQNVFNSHACIITAQSMGEALSQSYLIVSHI
jgi:hypothetical protein